MLTLTHHFLHLTYNQQCLPLTSCSVRANLVHVSRFTIRHTTADDIVRQDTYTVSLPDNLPPTFRGRALKFSYELVIGTCRASASAMRSSSNLGPTGANSISRVMKVPIRVYNHVAGKPVRRCWSTSLTTFHSWQVTKTVRPAVACGEAHALRGDCAEGGGRSLEGSHPGTIIAMWV